MDSSNILDNTEQKRPIGVTIMSYFLYITGAVYLLIAMFSFVFGSLIWSQISNFASFKDIGITVISYVIYLVGALLFLSAILSFVIGYGLWKLRNWARITMISSIVPGIAITFFISVFNPMNIFWIIPQGLMLYILLEKKTKEAFS